MAASYEISHLNGLNQETGNNGTPDTDILVLVSQLPSTATVVVV